MWLFRRRRKTLTPAEQLELDELFAAIPDLELPYYFREEVSEIFDSAGNRQEAARRLEELRAAMAGETELLEFFALYDRWRDGILAYFDNRETSAQVEGLNNKARVITRRSYGIKHVESLWKRLVLDVNRVTQAARRTVRDLHALARGIQATFAAYYT